MAFADLAPNQMVSFTDAQTSGIALNAGQSPVTSNQCMTKQDIVTLYNVNTSLLTGFANNQLVPKSSWAAAAVTAYHYYFSSFGEATSSESCNQTNNGADVLFLYANTNTGLVVGQILYSDAGLTIPYNGHSAYFGILAGDAIVPDTPSTATYRIEGNGMISEIVTCPVVQYGGTIVLDIPGVGNGIAPDCPGCSIKSGYSLGSTITIRNLHGSQSILFKNASLAPPYEVLVQQGPARLMRHTSTPTVVFYTTPADGDIIPPNSFAGWLAFSKTGGGGIVVLSLETMTNAGGRQQFFWTFNI